MGVDKSALMHFVDASARRLFQLKYASPEIKKAEGAVFEAYIHACVAEAVSTLSPRFPGTGIVEAKSPDGNAGMLVLRKQKRSVGSAGGEYSFVVLRIGDRVLELHTDTPVRGTSNMPSELDVALLNASICEQLRLRGYGDPASNQVGLLIEAKCYSHQGLLKPTVGRAFMGLCDDFQRLPLSMLVTTVYNAHIADYVAHHRRSRGGDHPIWFFPNLTHESSRHAAFIRFLAEKIEHAILLRRQRPTLTTATGTNTKRRQEAAQLAVGVSQPGLFQEGE